MAQIGRGRGSREGEEEETIRNGVANSKQTVRVAVVCKLLNTAAKGWVGWVAGMERKRRMKRSGKARGKKLRCSVCSPVPPVVTSDVNRLVLATQQAPLFGRNCLY